MFTAFFSFFLFVILRPTREFVTHRNVTITSERLQILTYSCHSWPLSSEGSLAYLTYCNIGQQFIMVISKKHDTGTCCLKLGCGAVATRFNNLVLLRSGTKSRSPTCEANVLPLSHWGLYVYSTDSEV